MAMDTGNKGLSTAEEMEKVEAAWEEEMVRRNRLANLGLPVEEKQVVERFEDGVTSVGQLERCGIPSPRTFFSRSGHWSDMELGAAVQQGLWEVSTWLEKKCLNFCQLTYRGTVFPYSQHTSPKSVGRHFWVRRRVAVSISYQAFPLVAAVLPTSKRLTGPWRRPEMQWMRSHIPCSQ